MSARGTAPGWYPDPEMADTRRYWDGSSWTDHRAPVTAAAGDNPGSSTGRILGGTLAAILLAAGIFWVISEMEGSNDGLNCAVENAERAQDGRPQVDCPTDF